GVTADIAQDFGTDPRSLAYGLTEVTGTQYHAVVDTNGAWDATKWIVHDILTYRQPISVFVDHGQHSVIVSGVEAKSNPLTDPGSITAIHVWDPGSAASNSAIQSSMHEVVPLSVWLGGSTDLGFAQYFKYPYAANQYGAYPFDPDPSVGPYTYVPALYNHLWIGHYVYVSPLGYVNGAGAPTNVTSTSYVSDWEFNQYGALIAGEASSGWPATPTGYSGAIVPMPTNPPPPPPPVHVFSAKPLPKPHPKAVPKPMPTPLPTATPPRARPSPTPAPPASNEAILPDTAAVPARCTSITCALAAMPPIWALSMFGALLLVALLLTVAMFTLRRRVQSRLVGQAAAGVDAPLMPPMLVGDGDATPSVASESLTERPASDLNAPRALGEPLAPVLPVLDMGDAPDAGPVVVPVLDADVTSSDTDV
ncbi:MAG TPA: hypothetical protein VE338_16590, partial [Ktedonobacterales bacterium]|nr:hypothetical protein [Ktedonobacterales bacterium]